MPLCFWSFAGPCCAFNRNCEFKGEKLPPYATVHGEMRFSRFVFGQAVVFKPAQTIYKFEAKVEARRKHGVFLGYDTTDSQRFTGQFVVTELSEFKGKVLAEKVPRGHFKGLKIHKTDVCLNPVAGEIIRFPLADKYRRCMETLDGIELTADLIKSMSKDYTVVTDPVAAMPAGAPVAGPGPPTAVISDPTPLETIPEADIPAAPETVQDVTTGETRAPVEPTISCPDDEDRVVGYDQDSLGRWYAVDVHGKRVFNWKSGRYDLIM